MLRLRRACRIALCGIFAAAVPAAGARDGPSAVTELRLSPIALSAEGEITVTFRLARPGTAEFSLTRVAPVRRRLGTFGVRGRAGLNRFAFPGRIDRRLLTPGTYRLAAAGGRRQQVSAVFVVASERPVTSERAATGTPRRPWLIGFLLVAIALFGLASLPRGAIPGPRNAEALDARRPVVAVAGAVALGVAVALYAASLL